VRHGGKIINFVRLGFVQDFGESDGIGHIAEMQMQPLSEVGNDSVNSSSIVAGTPPLDSVNDVPFTQKESSQISTILSGDAGNQCRFCHTSHYIGIEPKMCLAVFPKK
jgi:hypothetical protein